jgi:integrase
MANMFRPEYTKVDPKTGKKVTRRSRKWYGRVRDVDGVVRRVPLCTDKVAAQAMLLSLIRETELRAAGLVDAATNQLTRPLIEHIAEYRTHLSANARSEKHIGETIRLIKNIADVCRYRILTDLQSGSDAMERYLADRREQGSSHRTINADLVAVRSFCRWLMQKRFMRQDPTSGLHRLNVEEDRRLERRPLSDSEAQRLISATFQSTRDYCHLTGKDRSVLYTLAQRTGLRRKELRSLTPGSFDLDSSPPIVQLKAAQSKRRKHDILPLPADVAETMRAYLAGRPADKPVWPGSWWRRSAEMLRSDLLDADIEPEDPIGRVVDFHGQRTTFITALARAGVPPATAQKLARHSDINLTLGTYTRLHIDELAGAVDKLSKLRPSSNQGSAEDQKASLIAANTEPAAQDNPLLSKVVTAWDGLPEHIRQTILILVETASGGQTERRSK